MADTYPHNAPKRGKLLKLPNKYLGWLGESLYSQEGRKFRKRVEHRAMRRHGNTITNNQDKE